MTSSALITATHKLRTFQFGRLAQLWILAVLVLAYSVLEMAIANSLFLTKVGAGQLPLVFILIGLGSLPSYLIFSQVVDRYSRPKLFQIALTVAIVIALGLRALITLDSHWVYYLLMVVLFFQWDFHNTILYSSLLTDYFTATEYKQKTPAIGIGQAVGMLVGGCFTTVLPQFLSTEDLLYFVPILMGAAIALLHWLEQSQVKLVAPSSAQDVGIIEALKTFPKLVQSYPLMLFLAGSSFLLVIIYLTTEFLWFSVYEQYFTSNELTQFLGVMRIVVSLLQIIVLYCFTRPLLHWMGVSRMNVVYPITTLISIISFLFSTNLWTAIGLHINGDGFFKSINIPIHQLNYNAIPEEFIGRIRTLSDGVFYSVGLTSVGILLVFAHAHLNLTQISWIATSLGLLFLLIRIPMGRFYGSGLEDMIRANTINLNQIPDGGQLPKTKSVAFIRDWIKRPSLEAQYQALDLAIELNCSIELLDDILGLPNPSDDLLRQKILLLLVQTQHKQLDHQLKALLASDLSAHRAIALEALIARGQVLSSAQLEPLLNSEVVEIRLLAALAQAPEQVLQSNLPFNDAAGQALLRITPYRSTPEHTSLILNRLGQSTQFAIAGLRTLTQLKPPPSSNDWQIVVSFLEHPEAEVRALAYSYLGKHYPEKALDCYRDGFEDPEAQVRDRIAHLVAQSPKGLSLAQQQLQSHHPLRQLTATVALAQINDRAARDSLFDFLKPKFQLEKRTRQWRSIMGGQTVWLPLQITVEDFQERLIQTVLLVLAKMGYEPTIQAINNALMYSNGRDRAHAVEVLSSFKERRFVRPLLSILEESPASTSPTQRPAPFGEKEQTILVEALQSADHWMVRGAIATLAKFPEVQFNELAPALRTLWHTNLSPLSSMDQILLLKQVPIFQNLTLNELDLIQHELQRESVLAQQVIYTEGSWGQYFYMIESGTVELTKCIGNRSYELKQVERGEYFGEICLFDDAPHWDGAIAQTDSSVLKLEKEKFKALLMQRPRISLEICRYLSQRLREYDNFFCDIQSQNRQ